MTLEVLSPGRFKLHGTVNFATSPGIEQQGRRLLPQARGAGWEIDLSGIVQTDSSALSVCLSWIRLARDNQKTICFSGMPSALGALAQVCGIQDLFDSASCPPPSTNSA